MRRRSRRRLLGILVITTWLGHSGAQPTPAAEPATAVRAYDLPGHGKLELAVPKNWKEEVRRPAGLPPTITFTPPRGNEFHVQITALWSPQGDPGFNTPEKVRALVEQSGRGALPQARERTLVVQTLQGGTASVPLGYFYTLTDKAPGPDEYPFMTQGAVAVGELLLTFTVLQRQTHGPEPRRTLDMLAGGRHIRR